MTAENKSKLDELSKSYNGLSSINGEVEKKVRYLETRAINLVITYLFLQILILFCISSRSSSNIICNNSWTPFFLSLCVAIIVGLTLTITITEWAGTQYHYDLNSVELEMIHYHMYLVENNQMKMYESRRNKRKLLKPDIIQVYKRSIAGVKKGRPFCGVGAVIRDDKGWVVAALSKSLPGSFSPEVGELLALREGLLLAQRLKLKISCVELDASNVVSKVSTFQCPC
ncbi:hypothetical protein Q3G72_001947 [Acer saccharum]|nr:hypothetical protein Q3G72_001947 [Acer saccharum]